MKTFTRRAQKEQTRKTLIESSFNVFSSQGFSSTNTSELAKWAHVSHGTIFLHFPKRDDLIFAVMDEFGDQLASKFDEATQNIKGLEGMLNAHLKTLIQFEGFYTHLVRELSYLPDKVRSRFFILQSAISHQIYIEAKKEMSQGKIKMMEGHQFFNTWVALLHYYLANKEIFSPGQSVITAMGNELLQHFLNLIKK